ncbi:MAG: ZIP family metal transporter [Candidatus Anstonellaceae archaeon]
MLFSSWEMLLESNKLGGFAIAIFGFLAGVVVLFAMEKLIPHAHSIMKRGEISNQEKRAALIAGAITLHNIPEGFAIASGFAASGGLGWLVSLSIAAQDFPEGLIVAAPLIAYGVSKKDAIFWGIFSGAVEGAAAIAGYAFLFSISSITPLALSFSAGAMVFVTFFELLPDAFSCKNKWLPVISILAGFATAYAISMLLL